MIDLVVPGDRDRASLPDYGGACHAPRPARMIAQGTGRLNLRNRRCGIEGPSKPLR